MHVPGLLLSRRLRALGVPARVNVLEALLPDDKRTVVAGLKRAYHRSYRFAQASRKLSGNTGTDVPADAAEALFAGWNDRGVSRFVVFSGYWLDLVRRYQERTRVPVPVDLCRGDALPMQSFLTGGVPGIRDAREVNLADLPGNCLPWTIPVTDEPPVPWPDRRPAVLVHGGGWGLGTYRERAGEIVAAGIGVDLVVYEPAEEVTGARRFMLDPDWHPWQDDGFPPWAPVPHDGSPPRFTRADAHPQAFGLARTATAIVSKPGAGTLLDSLWSATPLVLLEPWTESEHGNATLWRRLGLGIPFDEWRAGGFATAALAPLHENLRTLAPTLRDYAGTLATAPKEKR
ncbi:hypothetical protein JCM9534A_15650 [Catenuloplanes indicus JCM 9534]